ncbi:MAG: MBL fold metallo-hydrolase [Clostridiales bacterium]|nr:MBL fold metallo-hydrolase [Clostridiales bacterium]
MCENTQKLFDNIYIIKVPLPGNPLKNVNNYFIKGTGRNLLIDTAFNMPECSEALQSGLSSLGADLGETDIFLTHLHSDHTGLASEIAVEGTCIYTGETDRVLLEKFMEIEAWNDLYKKNLMLGFSVEEIEWIKDTNPASRFLPQKETKYIGITEGYTFEVGDLKLRCIDTPGHTPGNMCIYEETHGILFSGDHIIFDISPNITSWTDVPDSLGLYLESLEKIKKLDISHTFSAHRSVGGDVYKRIDELIVHHEKRLSEVERIVRASGDVSVYDTAAGMTWSIRAKNWGDFPVTQKWFAVGEASAHLDYLVCRGLVKSAVKDGVYRYYI